jgi:hypothetical protein
MPRRTSRARPHRRNGFWYLVRRVPEEFAEVDPRPRVNLTTGIRVGDDPRGFLAKDAVAKLDAELLRYWRDLKAGRKPEPLSRFKEVSALAHQRGLDYLFAPNVAALAPPNLFTGSRSSTTPKALRTTLRSQRSWAERSRHR